jgi:integrase
MTPCRRGEPLSAWSLAQIKRHCRTIFEAAVDWQLLAVNPFRSLRFKKLSTKRWYRMPVSEYHALLGVAKTLREKVAYALFYTAALRLHEAFALTWDSVDFANGIVVVNNREGSADVPEFSIKDHEKRRIPVPPHTIDLLTQLHAEVSERVPFILLTRDRFDRVKTKWHDVRREGLPWKNRYLVNNTLRTFKAHVKRAGIKPVGKFTVHTLRKCCGQNWADHLPMNVVKELMGHSNISTTAEFYSTVDRDHEVKAARVMQSLLDAGRDQQEVTEICADFAPESI